MHALVWAGDTSPASVEHADRADQAAGFDLLEFSLHDSLNLDVAGARAQLARRAAGRLLARPGLRRRRLQRGPRPCRRGEKLLHDSLAITHDLGGTHFTGALYSALGKYGRRCSAGRRNVVAVLRALADEARQRGMTLGLEICNRYETNVINTARQRCASPTTSGRTTS